MSEPLTPQPAIQSSGRGPHWHSREVLSNVNVTTFMALIPIIAAGSALFGAGVLLQTATAIGCGVSAKAILCVLTERRLYRRSGQTVVLATVLALTLPPQCGLAVAGLGAVLMVLAVELFGGVGHYLWHPVLVARVLLCFAFPGEMLPEDWSVLKKTHLLVGDLDNSEALPANLSWFDVKGSPEVDAWRGTRPLETLLGLYRPSVAAPQPARDSLLQTIRSDLPPASDCLLGTTGGGVGETSVIVILLGGLFLVYRGYVHWTLPLGAVLGLFFAAALLPIPGMGEGEALVWWPIRLRWTLSGHPSLPLGLVLACYHLIVGGFVFATFFVAPDMTSSPLRQRGHLYFGMGIGVLTVALRLWGFSSGASYWAILIMNTTVPLIDRLTRRRPYGT